MENEHFSTAKLPLLASAEATNLENSREIRNGNLITLKFNIITCL